MTYGNASITRTTSPTSSSPAAHPFPSSPIIASASETSSSLRKTTESKRNLPTPSDSANSPNPNPNRFRSKANRKWPPPFRKNLRFPKRKKKRRKSDFAHPPIKGGLILPETTSGGFRPKNRHNQSLAGSLRVPGEHGSPSWFGARRWLRKSAKPSSLRSGFVPA